MTGNSANCKAESIRSASLPDGEAICAVSASSDVSTCFIQSCIKLSCEVFYVLPNCLSDDHGYGALCAADRGPHYSPGRREIGPYSAAAQRGRRLRGQDGDYPIWH